MKGKTHILITGSTGIFLSSMAHLSTNIIFILRVYWRVISSELALPFEIGDLSDYCVAEERGEGSQIEVYRRQSCCWL